ncbi:hypothetical protein ABZP36_010123 [Zizania latifolia]
MEAHKVRFVRCPGCLQLLVEYPSIPVYQCGGCGAVLRAKNRAASTVSTNTESGEQKGFSNNLLGDPQDNKLICTDGQKIAPSSDAQSSVVPEKITSASEERTMPASKNVDSGKHVDMECSLVGGNITNSDVRIGYINNEDEGAVSNSSLGSMRKIENVGTDGNANNEKCFITHDGSISNEVCTTPSMIDVDLGAGSNSNLTGEVESLVEGKCSLSNNNVNCQEIVAGCQPDGETESRSNNVNCQEIVAGCQPDGETESRSNNVNCQEIVAGCQPDGETESRSNNVNCQDIVAGCQPDGETESRSNNVNCQEIVPGCQQDDVTESKSNSFSAGTKDRSQPCEGLQVESHEDLIEELVRSLSLSDDEQDFVDIADNSELNDALRSQIGSCRFSSGNKTSDAPRADPHGQLIEGLEMSFSDAEELLDQNVMVAHNEIVENVSLDDDGKQKHILDMGGANSYEESVPPLDDGHIKPGQNFQQNELAAVSMKEKEEGHLEEINVANHAEADSGTVPVQSNLSTESFCAVMPPSCDKTTEEESKTYIGRKLCQGLSLDSEEFRSIQNFIESQMDGTSSSLSSGSPSHVGMEHKKSNKFNKIDCLERLKKMEDLRDQLNQLCSQKGLGDRYKSKGFEHLQQQSSYKHIEHHPCGFDDDSMLSSGTIDPYYDHEKPPKYQSPVPFSPTRSCCHYGHRQPHIPYNCSAWEFNSYYQSSYAGSTILEQESLSSSYKEQKRAVRKHILRSLSGASPFTICNGCFNLVQVPSNIYVSKRKVAKFQCGWCSKALVLSFPATHSEDAKFSEEVNQKPSKRVHSRVVNMDGAESFSAKCSRGDPMSISTEECGASFSRSLSGRTSPAIDVPGSGKKVSESALHWLMGYDSASQLLRHSRVFDDGYDSFESMVPVSKRVSRRKNL